MIAALTSQVKQQPNPKQNCDLALTVVFPPQKNGIICYILTNIYIPPSNSNLPGSVTAIKMYGSPAKIMLSKETTYSQAMMNLASVLDQICDKPQIINYFLA